MAKIKNQKDSNKPYRQTPQKHSFQHHKTVTYKEFKRKNYKIEDNS
jgi:hypothetical protein